MQTQMDYSQDYVTSKLNQSFEAKKTSSLKANQKQYIYVIPDGIDILKDKYRILKQDIQCYIDLMLPDKEEIERKYPYLTMKEKIKMLMPSEQIREQIHYQFLADVGAKLNQGEKEKEYISLFDINKNKVKDLMDIHDTSKVFIVSEYEQCKGVDGIESIEQKEFKQDECRAKAKQAFIMACEKWILNHKVELENSNDEDNIRNHPAFLYRIKNKQSLPKVKRVRNED